MARHTIGIALSVLAFSGLARAQQPPPPYPYPQQPYPQQQYPQQQYPQQQPYPYQPYGQQQTPYSPYPQSPPPPSSSSDDDKPGWELDTEVWGLRGTSLDVNGGDRPANTLGLGLGSIGLANGQRSILNYRAQSAGHLGGGSGGFEGALLGSVTIGLGWLVDGSHGPFIRGGFQGQLQGNDSFFLSMIRFPRGEVGWHIGSRRGLVLEFGGTAAPMLDGRFNAGDDAKRRLGSTGSYGVYGDLFLGALTATIEWIHTNAVSLPKTAVNDLAGHVCLGPGFSLEKKKYGLGLCFDGRYTTGDVGFGDPFQTNRAGTTYLGLTLGIGSSVSKDR